MCLHNDSPSCNVSPGDICRKFEFGPSCIIGATDFILRQPRRFRVAARARCRALRLRRPDFDRLAAAQPEARPWSLQEGVLRWHPGGFEGVCGVFRVVARMRCATLRLRPPQNSAASRMRSTRRAPNHYGFPRVGLKVFGGLFSVAAQMRCTALCLRCPDFDRLAAAQPEARPELL